MSQSRNKVPRASYFSRIFAPVNAAERGRSEIVNISGLPKPATTSAISSFCAEMLSQNAFGNTITFWLRCFVQSRSQPGLRSCARYQGFFRIRAGALQSRKVRLSQLFPPLAETVTDLTPRNQLDIVLHQQLSKFLAGEEIEIALPPRRAPRWAICRKCLQFSVV